ncbi:hypothetical protein D1007_40481 [Hordeum vulgare]|nr:hypothetical protein D1007_40481 [Hordeum vulgare]KAI5016769.1 hypothetical protein ZWY2020_006620 [Hordeum vulgare]
MTKKSEVITTKKEEACTRNEVKEGKTGKRFDTFMEIQHKKLKIQENFFEINTPSKDSKMLFMKMLDLDPDATQIVQAYRATILKCLAKPKEDEPAEERGLLP